MRIRARRWTSKQRHVVPDADADQRSSWDMGKSCARADAHQGAKVLLASGLIDGEGQG